MAQFWPKAAVANNCILIDNKLAIPEQLRIAILARLHRSHPGQAAMMDATEYILWPFLYRQIVNVCEKCLKCNLFGKNIKTSKNVVLLNCYRRFQLLIKNFSSILRVPQLTTRLKIDDN